MELVTDSKDLKKLEDLDAQIKKEDEYRKNINNTSADSGVTTDKEIISFVNSLKRCAHFFHQKGRIVE